MTSLPLKWLQHDAKIRPYRWAHRLISWARTFLGLVLLISLWKQGVFQSFSLWTQSVSTNSWIQWCLFFGGVGLAWKLLSLPFGIASHRVEARFGLTKQPVSKWIVDVGKGLLLGAVLGAFAFGLIFLSMKLSPSFWWLITAVFFFLFSILLAQLAPIVLIPIFMKLEPLEAGALKERLLSLCQQYQIPVKEVYHLGMSEKTEKGNAAFVGIGKTKRIIIGDTLYQKFPAEQVEAVFGHELGHQVHWDLWRGILLSVVTLIAGFGVANFLWLDSISMFVGAHISEPLGLFAFFFLLSFVQMPIGVIQALHTRSREWAADGFAAKKLGLGEPLADALERLTYQNFGQFKPNGFIEFLTYSHPAPWRRITSLRSE